MFLKWFLYHVGDSEGSMVNFGPRNALNEKCPATFLVRNVMDNTFRTCLRHLRSIWGSLKCYTSANKFAIFLVHLGSFYDLCGFLMHKSSSDHPKVNDRMHVQAFLESYPSQHKFWVWHIQPSLFFHLSARQSNGLLQKV